MSVESFEKDGITIVNLSGKIMGGPEAGEINDRIHQMIDAGKLKLIINLKNVDWMNSSGLGILIGAITTLKNNGGKLGLINLSDRVVNLLKITKLDTVFPVFSTLEEAIKQVG